MAAFESTGRWADGTHIVKEFSTCHINLASDTDYVISLAFISD